MPDYSIWSEISWSAFAALARPTIAFPISEQRVDAVQSDEPAASTSNTHRWHEHRPARPLIEVRLALFVEGEEPEALVSDIADRVAARKARRRDAALGETASEVAPVQHAGTLVLITIEVKSCG